MQETTHDKEKKKKKKSTKKSASQIVATKKERNKVRMNNRERPKSYSIVDKSNRYTINIKTLSDVTSAHRGEKGLVNLEAYSVSKTRGGFVEHIEGEEIRIRAAVNGEWLSINHMSTCIYACT